MLAVCTQNICELIRVHTHTCTQWEEGLFSRVSIARCTLPSLHALPRTRRPTPLAPFCPLPSPSSHLILTAAP